MSLRRMSIIGGCLLAASTGLAIGLYGVGQQSAKEAPAGFNTPSFNGTQSKG